MKRVGLVLGLCTAVAYADVFGAEIPRVVAHRGNYQYDDNALGGFRQSLAAGMTGYETDVQMTSDGGLVIMHDTNVARTTTGTGNVYDMTFAAVTNLTLKKSGEHVPSLQQIADLFKDRPDVSVEFEMKGQKPLYEDPEKLAQYVDGVHKIVTSTMPAGSYVFTSFAVDYLRMMRKRHPNAPTALIIGKAPASAADDADIRKAVALGCERIAPLAGTSADWVDAAQRAGLRVALWMVEDLDTWKSCRAKGAATVTSNHPIQLYTAVTNHLNCTR